MRYLANASSPLIRAAMVAGDLGQICTPREGRRPLEGVVWAADNGCYASGYPGDDRWLAWLARHSPARDLCLFATAPDVVGDAAATLARSLPFLPVIRDLGYRAALVAQDGLDLRAVPWEEFDVLFLGGSTDFKIGPQAQALTTEAVARGVPVHMGRVNSRKRYVLARSWGCSSVDGTHLTFRPDRYLPEVLSWLHPTPSTDPGANHRDDPYPPDPGRAPGPCRRPGPVRTEPPEGQRPGDRGVPVPARPVPTDRGPVQDVRGLGR